ncbi:uncharacterized protein DS421_4g120540 [Arachis hypogaea]|nr:uncharacterized protein DS421_4g120540 [Arachis hypogaea]
MICTLPTPSYEGVFLGNVASNFGTKGELEHVVELGSIGVFGNNARNGHLARHQVLAPSKLPTPRHGTIQVANAKTWHHPSCQRQERHHARCQRPLAFLCTLPTPGSKHGALRKARARCQRAEEKECSSTTPGNCDARC